MTTQKLKTTVATFGAMKAEGKRISMLTCYDTTARLIEESSVNAILVGDSLGNVMLGYPDTLAVTVEDMITYGAAVVRGVKNTMVVVDMPFMSYQVTIEEAVRNAGRILKETHCNAVKLEGGQSIRETIARIVAAGIPVMGHVGMTPQSVMQYGGFKVQGRGDEAAERVFQDALAVQEAGAFAVVLECVPAGLASEITQTLHIPTIGIGAGVDCDGQVLVLHDMLGLYSEFTPRFVKRYAELGTLMEQAVRDYAEEVRSGAFPTPAHSFNMDEEERARLEDRLRETE